ncbi:MAG: hypothetical protein HC916_11255 [Coleofasciculaceae cyanobacterium SM2_1_6]|nr:hypothetical protein [Coleofasciculaceae cyanobacterium SM2_1_6]
MIVQTVMIIILVCGSASLGWLAHTLLNLQFDQSGKSFNDPFLVLLLIVAFLGIAIAAGRVYPKSSLWKSQSKGLNIYLLLPSMPC